MKTPGVKRVKLVYRTREKGGGGYGVASVDSGWQCPACNTVTVTVFNCPRFCPYCHSPMDVPKSRA